MLKNRINSGFHLISTLFTITVILIVLFAGCVNGVQRKDRDEDKPKLWKSAQVQIEMTDGQPDSPAPEYTLREYQCAIVPQANNQFSRHLSQKHEVIDTLNTCRGEAIGNILKFHAIESKLKGHSIIIDQYASLIIVSKHPLLAGPLIKRSIERKGWSEKTFQASALIVSRLEQKLRFQILTSKASTTLATMLSEVGALDAVVVDTYGEVIAATNPLFIISLYKQKGWEDLMNASGEKIFFTAPFEEPGYDFLVRKIAIPIHYPGQQKLIGWMLVKIYAGPIE